MHAPPPSRMPQAQARLGVARRGKARLGRGESTGAAGHVRRRSTSPPRRSTDARGGRARLCSPAVRAGAGTARSCSSSRAGWAGGWEKKEEKEEKDGMGQMGGCGVVFISVGPIFEAPNATVRVAHTEFDPSELTYDCGDLDVAVKKLTRSEAGNNAFLAVSSCGRWVVFWSGREGHKNLYIVDAAPREEMVWRVTGGQWIETMPSWSPDEKLIALSSNWHEAATTAVFNIY
ncbi:hypothetical protein CFC21_084414 [Triticum aestivum]|uniref:Dipeptidylpeptidase IV N-terminal domain-containing protein n=2 Tax=Triticum aestivum TaxID=4565 RepID=A0A3B6NTU3_WHEAT|nr:hypothetical protein CFC21_084414 [Triticum aestivum]